ncbi:MAG: AI-2E family transporter [Candidatus Peribacteria bacterium]|nr:MAG: AI-2E family transporter [Candidatus Peribacteria bacterium]
MLFTLIQRTENNIVVPVVMNRVLGVRSLIIFITMLIAAWLFGFIGVVMAVPLSVIITTFRSNENINKKKGSTDTTL